MPYSSSQKNQRTMLLILAGTVVLILVGFVILQQATNTKKTNIVNSQATSNTVPKSGTVSVQTETNIKKGENKTVELWVDVNKEFNAVELSLELTDLSVISLEPAANWSKIIEPTLNGNQVDIVLATLGKSSQGKTKVGTITVAVTANGTAPSFKFSGTAALADGAGTSVQIKNTQHTYILQ